MRGDVFLGLFLKEIVDATNTEASLAFTSAKSESKLDVKTLE